VFLAPSQPADTVSAAATPSSASTAHSSGNYTSDDDDAKPTPVKTAPTLPLAAVIASADDYESEYKDDDGSDDFAADALITGEVSLPLDSTMFASTTGDVPQSSAAAGSDYGTCSCMGGCSCMG
jgi:hypothetical protein